MRAPVTRDVPDASGVASLRQRPQTAPNIAQSALRTPLSQISGNGSPLSGARPWQCFLSRPRPIISWGRPYLSPVAEPTATCGPVMSHARATGPLLRRDETPRTTPCGRSHVVRVLPEAPIDLAVDFRRGCRGFSTVMRGDATCPAGLFPIT